MVKVILVLSGDISQDSANVPSILPLMGFCVNNHS